MLMVIMLLMMVMLLLTLVFCVDSTLCECGWAVTLPTGIARLPHTHNSVRMMMKVMRMVRMVLVRLAIIILRMLFAEKVVFDKVPTPTQAL